MTENRKLTEGDDPAPGRAMLAEAGITARSCDYGSCDRMRGHDGPHRCRCGGPVDGPANGCEWHTRPDAEETR